MKYVEVNKEVSFTHFKFKKQVQTANNIKIRIVGVWCVYFASSIVGDDKLVVAIILTIFLVAAYPGYNAMLKEEEVEYLQKHEYRYSSLERRVKELENKDDY